MIGELSSSHTYHGGRRHPTHPPCSNGLSRALTGLPTVIIIRSARSSAALPGTLTRSPLDLPGVPIKEGDYILAVNGTPLRIRRPIPTRPSITSATDPVELTYNTTPSMTGAKTVVVQTMSDESRAPSPRLDRTKTGHRRKGNGRQCRLYLRQQHGHRRPGRTDPPVRRPTG